MSGEPTMTEPPVPLALSRLQQKQAGRMPRGMRTHRPSLQLASLQEAVDETPRRRSDEPCARSEEVDDEDVFSDLDVRPLPTNGRRASDATFTERYTKLSDFDGTPPIDTPRRASLAVPPAGLDITSPPFNMDKGRRRSWAARLQLERKKRRKSGGNDDDEESDSPIYVRQKRPSWWNVFVPENVLRNR